MTAAPGVACAALEVALNRYLRLEPEALVECGRLAGRVLALCIDPPGWTFAVEFLPTGVRVGEAGGDTAAEVTVSGSPTVLAQLAARQVRGADSLPRGIRVDGDPELLTRFRRLLARVDFDPEEWVAPLLGDAVAHRAVGMAARLFSWSRGAADTLALDTAEYLREETGDLVHRDDVERWMDDVDAARDRAERLAARMQRLQRRLQDVAP